MRFPGTRLGNDGLAEGDFMKLGILGRKVGMTQIFDETGARIPVSVIDTSQCIITQIKTKEKEGYNSVQFGFGEKKAQNLTKAIKGHLKKANAGSKAIIKECRLGNDDDLSKLKIGNLINIQAFNKGDRVDVIGTTRGRGFTGVMKRYGFSGKNSSHGTHKYMRHGGSIGTNTYPGRTVKNRKMPGHMGNARHTLSNLLVVDVLEKENLLLVKGGIPGARNSIVMVRPAKKFPFPDDRNFC